MSEGLRDARRARGWSQDRLISEIELYARRHLADVASRASLRVYVSEWESGRRPISDRYAAIMRGLLGVTDAELRGADHREAPPVADGYADLLARIDKASSVSESMVKTFNDQTELLRTFDRQMGAAGLVDQMTGHLTALEDALNFAVLPGTRQPVGLALAVPQRPLRGRHSTPARSNALGGSTSWPSGRRRMPTHPCTWHTRWLNRRTCCARPGGRRSASTSCETRGVRSRAGRRRD